MRCDFEGLYAGEGIEGNAPQCSFIPSRLQTSFSGTGTSEALTGTCTAGLHPGKKLGRVGLRDPLGSFSAQGQAAIRQPPGG